MNTNKIICKPVGNIIESELDDFLSGQERRLLEDKIWRGFFAIVNEVTTGILLYRMQGEYLLMERIFVKPGYRRSGIGTEMLTMLCKFAKAAKKPLLFSFDATGNRDAFYRFVSSTHEFVIERQEGFEAYLTEEEVSNIGKKMIGKIRNIEFFFEQNNSVREEFITHLAATHEQIAWELKYNHRFYREDLCCCVMEKGVVQAVCLIKQQKNELELKLMYGRPNKGKQTAEALLASFHNIVEKKILPMRISPITEAEIKILNFICPEYEIKKRFYVAYYVGS